MSRADRLLTALRTMQEDVPDRTGPQVVEAQRKRVVRGGKVQTKSVCPSGFKAVDGKCVRMSPDELRARSKASKKTARKLKSKRGQIARKKAKSDKRRQAAGL